MSVKISVNICGIEFKNPILAAAGPPVRNSEKIIECAKGGAGGVVAKTISTEAAKPPKPCMAQIQCGFINTELWSELPTEQWIKKEYKIAKKINVPLIISLGYNAEQIGYLAPKVREFADALELSTHYLGEDTKPMMDAIRVAKESVDVPVFVKLSPNIPNIRKFAKDAVISGADAIVAVNSFGPAFSIDIETALPYMGSDDGYGWISGRAIKSVALKCVFEIRQEVNVPIIGVGGITNGRDAAEMLMAGASAVQICTAAIIHGSKIFGKVARELEKFLSSHGYKSVSEISSLTLKKMKCWKKRRNVPEISAEKCTGCGLCATSCPYDAISVYDKAMIDKNKCFGCGLCLSRCRLSGNNAISWG